MSTIYGSALYRSAPARTPNIDSRPATSTLPLRSDVAVWPWRPGLEQVVVVQFPLTGSYSSAVRVNLPLTTSTCPFGSNVAVCSLRAFAMLPVGVDTPVAGSYEVFALIQGCNKNEHAPAISRSNCLEERAGLGIAYVEQ
jgi:hypothetical protein